MQLKIEVLPAPLGPMTANSSPGLTSNDTSSSAVTPPKRSVMSRTASTGLSDSIACDRERHRGVLLDQQHARALAVELDDRVADRLDEAGGKAERRLVEQQQP